MDSELVQVRLSVAALALVESAKQFRQKAASISERATSPSLFNAVLAQVEYDAQIRSTRVCVSCVLRSRPRSTSCVAKCALDLLQVRAS